jgi:hypothetical protein
MSENNSEILSKVEPRIRPVRVLKPLKISICASCGEEGQEEKEEKEILKQEVERLREQLASTRETILRMHEREERVKQRLLYALYCTVCPLQGPLVFSSNIFPWTSDVRVKAFSNKASNSRRYLTK